MYRKKIPNMFLSLTIMNPQRLVLQLRLVIIKANTVQGWVLC